MPIVHPPCTLQLIPPSFSKVHPLIMEHRTQQIATGYRNSEAAFMLLSCGLKYGCWQVWAMLHSGSRGIGNQTAKRYDQIAKERGFPDPGQLNYLEIDSQDGQNYLQARLIAHQQSTVDC